MKNANSINGWKRSSQWTHPCLGLKLADQRQSKWRTNLPCDVNTKDIQLWCWPGGGREFPLPSPMAVATQGWLWPQRYQWWRPSLSFFVENIPSATLSNKHIVHCSQLRKSNNHWCNWWCWTGSKVIRTDLDVRRWSCVKCSIDGCSKLQVWWKPRMWGNQGWQSRGRSFV